MAYENVVGIIGWPVSHSISPAMQNKAFAELGLTAWIYVPMPVSKIPYIRIKEAVLGLRALSFKGANVTVPYKEAVVPYLDRLSDMAKAIGAVNTISVDSEGRLVGHNTDGVGIVYDLLEKNIDVRDLHVLVLGAGGSARAVTYGLLNHGCKNLTILNRTKTKADDIAVKFAGLFKDANINTGILAKESMRQVAHPDLLINCTSIGMSDSIDEMPWDENIHFSKDQIIYDIIYNPAKTKLMKHAENDGATIFNGLGMLVHQGARSFKIWTGHDAPIAAMKSEAQSAILG